MTAVKGSLTAWIRAITINWLVQEQFLFYVLNQWHNWTMSKKRLQDYIATNDSCWMKTYAHWSHFFSLLFLNLLLNLFFSMAVTRSQLENLSKDELINRLLQVENIEDKLEHLNKWFENFLRKCNELHSELQVSRSCSNLLCNWVIKLEKCT